MQLWLHTVYIYMSFKLEDGTVQKENQDGVCRWGECVEGGIIPRKSSVQPKKRNGSRGRLAKESGDWRSSMKRQEPCHRAAAACDRMAVIRSGEQDVGMAHPGHRAG